MLEMSVFALIFLIQAIILILGFYYYCKHRNIVSVILIVGDLLSLPLNYFSVYSEFPWTSKIYSFAPVEYSASDYNEGKYYGEWEDEYPQGYGRLTYRHFVDGKYYSLIVGENQYKALYYEGYFEKGWREGEGKVVYEGGFYDKGMFYGRWMPGKIVFRGQRWDANGRHMELEIEAINGLEAIDHYTTNYWIEGSN